MSVHEPIPGGLAELVLVVEDVPRAARFYGDVVGLVAESPATDGWAWFWSGEPERSPRLALRTGPLLFEEHSPQPPAERWGRVHFALSVHRRALEDAVARVAAHTTVHGPVRLEWMRATSYYFYDPEGNLVEYWSPDP